MKVAAILMIGALVLTPGLALAQSAGDGPGNRGARSDVVRNARAAVSSVSRTASDPDRAIDAEMRRIDRMMTICTGC